MKSSIGKEHRMKATFTEDSIEIYDSTTEKLIAKIYPETMTEEKEVDGRMTTVPTDSYFLVFKPVICSIDKNVADVYVGEKA